MHHGGCRQRGELPLLCVPGFELREVSLSSITSSARPRKKSKGLCCDRISSAFTQRVPNYIHEVRELCARTSRPSTVAASLDRKSPRLAVKPWSISGTSSSPHRMVTGSEAAKRGSRVFAICLRLFSALQLTAGLCFVAFSIYLEFPPSDAFNL